MAWRPSGQLVAGELDNTVLGKVTGYMHFAGVKGKIKFDLEGDFHRDIRGCKIRIKGEGEYKRGYMEGFEKVQKGNVGDITAGNPIGKDSNGEPIYDYSAYPYIEWYSDDNGRVVLELDKSQVKIIGTPIPAMESFPIDRAKQHQNMNNFMNDIRNAIMENPPE
jgi:hypothetical protein